MIYLEMDSPYQKQLGDGQFLVHAAETTLHHLKAGPRSSLSVRVTGDEVIRDLNREYRAVDSPTDVLAFSAGYQDPDTGDFYLGDILVSYPRAKAQAEQENHTTDQELQLLVVHGVLHLLGFDHLAPREKERMWKLQGEILNLLGLTIEVK